MKRDLLITTIRLGVVLPLRMAGGSLADECCPQELAALVEHALFDQLVSPEQERLRNRQRKRFRSLQVYDQMALRGLLDGKVGVAL